MMDMLLVGIQIMDQAIRLISCLNMPVDMSIMRLLRLVRLTRIARLVRVFRLFDELRTMVRGLSRSFGSLLWAMIFLSIAIYVFSIVFIEAVMMSPEAKKSPELQFWFGSLHRTILTMFECIVGGVGWDHVVRPLMAQVSPCMGVVFCIYIGVSLLSMMNCVTAVLVEKVMHTVREDKDVHFATQMCDLFTDAEESITFEGFRQKLHTKTMRDFFETISVDISAAQTVYNLLDINDCGRVDTSEMISGFLKMRGPARALEVMMIMRSIRDVHAAVVALQSDLRTCEDS